MPVPFKWSRPANTPDPKSNPQLSQSILLLQMDRCIVAEKKKRTGAVRGFRSCFGQ